MIRLLGPGILVNGLRRSMGWTIGGLAASMDHGRLPCAVNRGLVNGVRPLLPGAIVLNDRWWVYMNAVHPA